MVIADPENLERTHVRSADGQDNRAAEEAATEDPVDSRTEDRHVEDDSSGWSFGNLLSGWFGKNESNHIEGTESIGDGTSETASSKNDTSASSFGNDGGAGADDGGWCGGSSGDGGGGCLYGGGDDGGGSEGDGC